MSVATWMSVVRPAIATDDDEWGVAVADLRSFARVLAGNSVAVLEVSEADIAGKPNGKQLLWIDIAREGVVVHGPSLDRLRQGISA